MRTKSEAQIFLEQVEKLDVQTECKLIEKQQWHDLALSITSQMGGERVQSSGSQSKMADALSRCVDAEGEIDRAIEKLVATKKEVVAVIEHVENPTEYKLLHMKYIQHLELKTIANHFKSDYTWATTVHGRALKSVEGILGKEVCNGQAYCGCAQKGSAD